MTKVTNVIIVGVGGQGTILASKIMSRLALSKGYDVKVSEIHGMSQRGGSVVTQVRFGEDVHSPIIEPGTADYILSFEKLEAIRALSYLKKDGVLIVNDQTINPMPVIIGMAEYPNDINEYLEKSGIKYILFDALSEAVAAGNQKSSNMVLIGVWSALMGCSLEEVKIVLAENIPAKLLDVNNNAIERGFNIGRANI